MTQPTTRRILKCVVALAAVVVVGLGPALSTAAVEGSPSAASVPSAASAPQASSSVMIMDHRYQPASLTVTVGETVTWTNHDQAQHVVAGTSGPDALQAPLLAQGQSWSHTFDAAGSYSYICGVHPDMVASLTVNPAPAPTTEAGTSGDAASSPDELATRPTGTTEPTTDLPPQAVAGVVVAIVLGTSLALLRPGRVGAVAPAGAAGAGGSGANRDRHRGDTDADDTAVMPIATDRHGATETVESDKTGIEERPVTATDALAQLTEAEPPTEELE